MIPEAVYLIEYGPQWARHECLILDRARAEQRAAELEGAVLHEYRRCAGESSKDGAQSAFQAPDAQGRHL